MADGKALLPRSTPSVVGSAPNAEDETTKWIDNMIQNNTHLNFVDRIARPELYPTLPLNDGSGNFATHKMGWSTIGKNRQPIVYPTVVYDHGTGTLQQLDDRAALDYALKQGEYLPFNSPQQADLFSREYKRHWRDGKVPKGYTP